MTGVHRAVVYLGLRRVGTITCAKGDSIRFVREPEWWQDPTHPVLGQCFEDDDEDPPPSTIALPSWFSNLVPEGPLRQMIANQVDVKPAREYWLLCRIGEDLPGNVRVFPERHERPVAPDEDGTVPEEIPEDALRFSLAGVQLKFSANRDDRGITIPVSGRGGSWILKLPDQRFEAVPENEFSMLRWASEAGLIVPTHEIVEAENVHGLPIAAGTLSRPSLLIQRFDRAPGGVSIHQEDLAQVLGVRPGDKYKHANYDTIVKTVRGVCPPEDVDELLRRLAFMVLCGNGDAHLKNFSLTYPDGRSARLSPAYDLVFTRAFITNDALGLKLSGERRFTHVSRDTFRELARRVGLDAAHVDDVVGAFVERAMAAWQRLRGELPLPTTVRDAVDAHLAQTPLASFRASTK